MVWTKIYIFSLMYFKYFVSRNIVFLLLQDNRNKYVTFCMKLHCSKYLVQGTALSSLVVRWLANCFSNLGYRIKFTSSWWVECLWSRTMIPLKKKALQRQQKQRNIRRVTIQWLIMRGCANNAWYLPLFCDILSPPVVVTDTQD